VGDGKTTLISAAGDDENARDRLWESVFDEIRRIAANLIAREGSRHEMRPTEFPGIVWERLGGDQGIAKLRTSRMFFGAVANVIREELVDRSRSRGRLKRGGGWKRLGEHGLNSISVGDLVEFSPDEVDRLVKAIDRLRETDEMLGELVWMKVMTPMSRERMKEYLGLGSVRSLDQAWKTARDYIMSSIGAEDA
jgi:hypothetical protein